MKGNRIQLTIFVKLNYLDHAEKSNMLFIFDDVWNEEYFEYLTFAKKSIVTSRYIVENKNTYRCIPAKVRNIFI